MKKLFTPIYGYPHYYEITREGEIKRSLRFKKDSRGRNKYYCEMPIVISVDKRSGYPVVKLTKPKGGCGNQYVHRLVAQTYLLNPLKYKYINHINGIKTDSKVGNLEWCTSSQNYRHAVLNKLCTPFRITPIVDTHTGEYFKSIKEASVAVGIQYHKLQRMISGVQVNTTHLIKAPK